MQEGSIAEPALTYLVACSGACSNYGQLSAQVIVRLGREKYGKPFCLAGLGAHLPGFLERAKQGRFIVIDGCPQQCALKTVEHAGFNAAKNVIISQVGVEKKSSEFDIPSEETEKVLEQVRNILTGKQD